MTRSPRRVNELNGAFDKMVALLFSRLMDYRHDRWGTLRPRFEEVVLEAGKTLWVGREIPSARPEAIRKEGIPRNASRLTVARLSQPDSQPTNALDMQSPLLPGDTGSVVPTGVRLLSRAGKTLT